MDYQPHERRIFGPYFNGERDVYGDPLRINRRLKHFLDGDPNAVISKYNSPIDDVRFEAAEQLMGAVILAFDMVRFDAGSGLGSLNDDCVRVLNQYLDWLEDRRSFTERPPTSPPSGLASSAAAPPMTRSSASS